jgi:ribosome-associated protein
MDEQVQEIRSEEELASLAGVSPRELAEAIAEIADGKKGRNVKVLYVEKKTVIADYFVLCTGNSSTHVKGLSGEIEYQTTRRGCDKPHVEGVGNSSWILLDYGSVIVHVFSQEAREFYNLDRLYLEGTELPEEKPEENDEAEELTEAELDAILRENADAE